MSRKRKRKQHTKGDIKSRLQEENFIELRIQMAAILLNYSEKIPKRINIGLLGSHLPLEGIEQN